MQNYMKKINIYQPPQQEKKNLATIKHTITITLSNYYWMSINGKWRDINMMFIAIEKMSIAIQ